jgi:putative DNA primase/helicase
MTSQSYAEEVSNSIVKQLKQGTAPWVQTWNPGQTFRPYNAFTGSDYKGMNALWLMSVAEKKGYQDNRWLTFRQASSLDAKVMRGEKSTTIQYWKWADQQDRLDENGKPVRDEAGNTVKKTVALIQPRVFYAKVFNADQVNGLEKEQPKVLLSEPERHNQAEKLLEASKANIIYQSGNRAFYRPSTDTITLPQRTQFPTADRFYATAFHELGHWSGHESRLNRDLAHPFGSQGYAREELRAEIASLMLGDQLEIGHDPGQHAAYIDSWIHALESDHREIFRAAADAEKIVHYVAPPELELSQSLEAEEPSIENNRIDSIQTPAISPELSVGDQPENQENNTAEQSHSDKESETVELPTEEKPWESPIPLPKGVLKDGESHFKMHDNGRIRATSEGVFIDKVSDAAIIAGMVLAMETYPGNAILVEGPLEFKQKAAELAARHGIPITFSDNNLNEHLQANLPTAFKVGEALEKSQVISREAKAPVQPLTQEVMPSMTQPGQTQDASTTTDTEPMVLSERSNESLPSTSPPVEKTFLAVPYSEKEEAKNLGAKWDKQAKSWYVQATADMAAFSKWIPTPSQPFAELSNESHQQAFAQTLADAGFKLNGLAQMDGKIHRVAIQGDKPGQQSGAYVGFLDGHPAGYFNNHKTGEKVNWKFQGATQKITEQDRVRLLAESAQHRQEREKALAQLHSETARMVEEHWNAGQPVTSHPYLEQKGVAAHGLRIDTAGTLTLPKDDPKGQRWSKPGNLLIPIRDIEGNFMAALSIDENGEKRLPKGSQKLAGHHVIGDPGQGDMLLFAEGYATAATLHELTGKPVVATFDSGNMPVVTEAYRAKYPEKLLVIAGDNDHTQSIKDNAGLRKAQEAAQKVDGHLLIPKFEKGVPGSDWNDMVKLRGKESVTATLHTGISLAAAKQKAQAQIQQSKLMEIVKEAEVPRKQRSLSLSR